MAWAAWAVWASESPTALASLKVATRGFQRFRLQNARGAVPGFCTGNRPFCAFTPGVVEGELDGTYCAAFRVGPQILSFRSGPETHVNGKWQSGPRR